MRIRTDVRAAPYEIVLERGVLQNAGKELDLQRKTLIVTDDGVPADYAEMLAAQAKTPYIYTIRQGEDSKSILVFSDILSFMLAKGFTRKDCVVAVGGGVVGDLAGFTAASYMRGVDFYNAPTTVLSQVDSSVGGKTAINLNGVKNIVGAFYQPKKVLIDPDVLRTLPPRQLSNGLAEAVKMAMTSDAALFRLFETEDPLYNIESVIAASVRIKSAVVAQDEKEAGLRRILNFGHTIGHGIESAGADNLYHGECVALGRLPMCSESARERLLPVLQKLNLPVKTKFVPLRVLEAISHDKKAAADGIDVTIVRTPGSFESVRMRLDEIAALLPMILEAERRDGTK